METLLGDPSRAKKALGWEAETPFEKLVAEMVDSDMTLVKTAMFDFL